MQNYFYQKRDRQPRRSAPPAVPSQPRRRRTGRRTIMLFVCALALVVGTAIAFSRLDAPELPQLPARPGLPSVFGPPEETQGGEAAATTIERAPLGDGTVLNIAPLPAGAARSFQEIYQENIASIVSIRGDRRTSLSFGTGVIFSERGYIITNAHVIEGCSGVTVTLLDGRVLDALLAGMDPETDLAVLKVEAQGLSAAVFGDSEQLRVGDAALAIGNPLGEDLKGTMTDGIISAINRDVEVDGYTMTLIQTTAALNSGNSGGALINAFGQVVGITNLKMQSYYSTVEGLGFAIPSATVKRVADDLIAQGYVSGRPAIGIIVTELSDREAGRIGCPPGVRVKEVMERSDAWDKGLRPGDVILSANGIAVSAIDELMDAKADLKAGDLLRLQIWRDGNYMTVDVELVEQHFLETQDAG